MIRSIYDWVGVAIITWLALVGAEAAKLVTMDVYNAMKRFVANAWLKAKGWPHKRT
jgi:hypothetical protein